MEFTKELLEKARSAKSAEELLELSKAEGVELTAEEAEKAFAELHKSGELPDDELDNVAGGRCDSKHSPEGEVERPGDLVYLYQVGQEVEVYDIGSSTKRATVVSLYVARNCGYYCPGYKVRYKSDNTEEKVTQFQIEQP